MKEKYINPFTYYGFKRLFGEEHNKDLLLDFLNELLKDKEGKLTDLSYLPNEKLPISVGDRKAIFDINCTNEKGEKVIIELQKAEQNFFDHTVFYSSFPIQAHARHNTWDFELKSVYTISILDFKIEENADKYIHTVKLIEQETNKVFYDKLHYIYIETPKFTKEVDDLDTRFEKWMFVLKNLPKLDKIPTKLEEDVFIKLFKVAEISKLSPSEYKKYEASLNAYRDGI